jgi:hypothetical protein
VHFPTAADNRALIAKLRSRAGRHRLLASGLASSCDATIVLDEAKQAELEAARLDLESHGLLPVGTGATPLHDRI